MEPSVESSTLRRFSSPSFPTSSPSPSPSPVFFSGGSVVRFGAGGLAASAYVDEGSAGGERALGAEEAPLASPPPAPDPYCPAALLHGLRAPARIDLSPSVVLAVGPEDAEDGAGEPGSDVREDAEQMAQAMAVTVRDICEAEALHVPVMAPSAGGGAFGAQPPSIVSPDSAAHFAFLQELLQQGEEQLQLAALELNTRGGMHPLPTPPQYPAVPPHHPNVQRAQQKAAVFLGHHAPRSGAVPSENTEMSAGHLHTQREVCPSTSPGPRLQSPAALHPLGSFSCPSPPPPPPSSAAFPPAASASASSTPYFRSLTQLPSIFALEMRLQQLQAEERHIVYEWESILQRRELRPGDVDVLQHDFNARYHHVQCEINAARSMLQGNIRLLTAADVTAQCPQPFTIDPRHSAAPVLSRQPQPHLGVTAVGSEEEARTDEGDEGERDDDEQLPESEWAFRRNTATQQRREERGRAAEHAAAAPRKSRAKKRERDPDAPANPSSAYIVRSHNPPLLLRMAERGAAKLTNDVLCCRVLCSVSVSTSTLNACANGAWSTPSST